MFLCVLLPPQALLGTALILFILRFLLAMLFVLVLIFSEQLFKRWSLISHMLDMHFSDVLIFNPLGSIACRDLIFPCGPVPCKSYLVDVERERFADTFHHVDTWEWLAIHLHGELP